MNEVAKQFSNGQFQLEVAPHPIDGFRVQAPGLARALGFRDAYRMLETIPEEEKGYTLASTPGGDQNITYVTEAGFYRVLGQRQPSRIQDEMLRARVEAFQNWVYREVLPSIRATGGYGDVDKRTVAELTTKADLARMVLESEEEKKVLEAALESATPAIEYHDRYVANDDAVTVGTWAAQFGLTDPQARKLLLEKNIIYRFSIGERWSTKKAAVVEEFEYRARAGRVSFAWFDLRPQHNAPRHHNGQVRQTLYIRQEFALELGKKLGLTPAPVQTELGDAS
jgi:prophage antirepressor-like protein